VCLLERRVFARVLLLLLEERTQRGRKWDRIGDRRCCSGGGWWHIGLTVGRVLSITIQGVLSRRILAGRCCRSHERDPVFHAPSNRGRLQTWFTAVDHASDVLHATVWSPLEATVLQPLFHLLSSPSRDGPGRTIKYHYVMLPAAPVLLGLAVTVPIVIGLVVLFLPLALPLVVALLVAVCTLGLVATLTYASTRAGRALLTPLVQPLAHTLLSTPVGQGLVYNIGPRPTPVSLCRSILPTDIWFRLALSIVLDGLGSASYLLPGLGEGFDVAWAPIQTILIMALYNHNNAPSAMDYLKYVSMAEELLPFTDVLSTAPGQFPSDTDQPR
jgi:hypothetical protein